MTYTEYDIREHEASLEIHHLVELDWSLPRKCGWLKVNTDVAIRFHEFYITISIRDSLNFLCMVYTERLATMDLWIGKSLALVEALALAKRQKWARVNFKCDSLILCKKIISFEPPTCWAVAAIVEFIRGDFASFRDWKIAWIPRKCNCLTYLLVKWVVVSGCFSFISLSCISKHIYMRSDFRLF